MFLWICASFFYFLHFFWQFLFYWTFFLSFVAEMICLFPSCIFSIFFFCFCCSLWFSSYGYDLMWHFSNIQFVYGWREKIWKISNKATWKKILLLFAHTSQEPKIMYTSILTGKNRQRKRARKEGNRERANGKKCVRIS